MSDPSSARAAPTPALFLVTAGLLGGQIAAASDDIAWRVVPLAMSLLAVAIAPRHILRPALGMALASAALGLWQVEHLRHPQHAPAHVQHLIGARVVLRGVLAERPVQRPNKVRLVIAANALRRGADWQAAEGRVMVTLRQPSQPWRRGDRVEAVVDLRQPRNFGNPGEFDFEAYLARRDIRATAFAADDRTWLRTPAPPGVGASLEAWRDEAAATIAATLPMPAAAIAAALLVGDAIALPADVRDRFARAGVSHVLSISGLHVGLVAGAAFVVLRWLLGRSERLLLYGNVPKLAMVVSLAPLGLYAAIAGDNVATIRSEIMGVLAVSAVLLGRPRDWLAPVAAAALAISLWQPGALFEIGFQLSFVAVLALVLGMPPILSWWNGWEERHLVRLRGRHWRWLRWLVLSEAVTVCATLATAPLTAWHFNQVSIIALIANPLIVPLLGLGCVSVGLIATIAVAVWPAAAPPLFACVGAVVRLADALVRLCAAVPGASVMVVTPSLLELALVYGALGALLLRPRALRRAVLAGCALGLLADAAYWAMPRGAVSVSFVSVGQGDCAVIEFPGSAVMVVDGGGLYGDFDVGRQVVAPFLWRRKISRIDVLALSHADFDHYGGETYLAAAFAPREFWWNGTPGTGASFAALWNAVAESGSTARTVSSGFARTIEGVEVRVLHPGDDARGGDNDRSLALQLHYGPTTVLLPGDLQADGERSLVARHGAAVRSTVLKVPHHGSRTSSSAALLQAVAPRFAVVSAGADNRFGFPHANVVDAYRQRGIELFRTDRDGAITLRIERDGAIIVTTGTTR